MIIIIIIIMIIIIVMISLSYHYHDDNHHISNKTDSNNSRIMANTTQYEHISSLFALCIRKFLIEETSEHEPALHRAHDVVLPH